jgi:hypothetical protein
MSRTGCLRLWLHTGRTAKGVGDQRNSRKMISEVRD